MWWKDRHTNKSDKSILGIEPIKLAIPNALKTMKEGYFENSYSGHGSNIHGDSYTHCI